MAHAGGLLEFLWHWTMRYAPSGDIGRWPDAAIAKGAGWTRDPEVFVSALIAERWADTHEEHRVVIHDWPTHADDSVHLALARATLFFCDGSVPKLTRMSRKEQARVKSAYTKACDAHALNTHNTRTQNALRHAPPSHPIPSLPLPSPPLDDTEAAVAGDPWSKPKAVYSEPIAAASDPSDVGPVRDILIGFGFNPSNAFNHAKKPGATMARVNWLVAEATRRLEAGAIGKDKAMGFVVAGIRDKIDPDPGPAIESPDERRLRVLTEAAREQENAA